MSAKKKKVTPKTSAQHEYLVVIAAPVVRTVAMAQKITAPSRKAAADQALEDWSINGDMSFHEADDSYLNGEDLRDQTDDPVLLKVELERAGDGETLECDECSEEFAQSDLKPVHEIKGLLDLLTPGERIPHGECPDCGGLVFGPKGRGLDD